MLLKLWEICNRAFVVATISTVICDFADKARLILDCVSGRNHSIKTIVIIENFDSELTAQAQQKSIEILSLRELEVWLYTHTRTHTHTHTLRHPW